MKQVYDLQDDPFYDPPEPHLIGNAYLKLLYLAYFMDSMNDLSLVGENGQLGSLTVSVIPCDETGQKNLAQEMDTEGVESIEDPKQLLGQKMYIKIVISNAMLPDNFCRDTFVEYDFMGSEGKILTFRTNQIYGRNARPNYNWERVHCFESITDAHLQYFESKNLIFRVLGYEEIKGDSQIPVEEEIEYANIKNNQKKQQQQQITQSSIDTNSTASNSSVQTQQRVQTNINYQNLENTSAIIAGPDNKQQDKNEAKLKNGAKIKPAKKDKTKEECSKI